LRQLLQYFELVISRVTDIAYVWFFNKFIFVVDINCDLATLEWNDINRFHC